MKSHQKQLEKRGFLPGDFDIDSYNLSFNEKLDLLLSEIPVERTLAARLLKNETDTENTIVSLIEALAKEKKLYPKIEISNTLVFYGKPSVIPLIKVLGEIGTNQYQIVPEKEFKKESYPLPRDIASRILAHIGKVALPELLNNLERFNSKQKSEAIDAVGYICFYNDCPETYGVLKKYYLENAESELIKWKIIRAFSGLPESESFLEMEKRKLQNERLKMEIERSVFCLKNRSKTKCRVYC